jgi:hypothetical protein
MIKDKGEYWFEDMHVILGHAFQLVPVNLPIM